MCHQCKNCGKFVPKSSNGSYPLRCQTCKLIHRRQMSLERYYNSRKYSKEHKKKKAEYDKLYRAKNREVIAKKQKVYRLEQGKTLLEKKRKYHYKNRDRLLLKMRERWTLRTSEQKEQERQRSRNRTHDPRLKRYWKKYKQSARENLDDNYIKSVLVAHGGPKADEITPELIVYRRELIRAKRALKSFMRGKHGKREVDRLGLSDPIERDK